MSEPCYLYRHWDESGQLLYVGISLHTVLRLTQHKATSFWADEIRSITIERFPSREKALEAERSAIRSEKPLHNKAWAEEDPIASSVPPGFREGITITWTKGALELMEEMERYSQKVANV